MLNKNNLIILFAFLLVFDLFIWSSIFFNKSNKNPEIYFLNVGQGDSELVVLPNDIKVLIDGGPPGRILRELSSVLKSTDRYIDLVVLSHPQLDHFGGLIDVFKRYQVGVFIYNGRAGEAKAFGDLEKAIRESGSRAVILAQGDKIKYQENIFEVVSPPKEFINSKELNDTTLVLKFDNGDVKALFTGDIGEKVENYLFENFDINIDVLKVGHHGSKFSSGQKFLTAASPAISAIEVGKNTYGHPTAQTLNRLAAVGSQIFRTDTDGTIRLEIIGREINIFERK